MNSKTKTPVKSRLNGACCQNCKAKFVIEPEDFEFYKKIGVPEPTLYSPDRKEIVYCESCYNKEVG